MAGIIYPFTTEAQDLEVGMLVLIFEGRMVRIEDRVAKVTTSADHTLITGESGRIYVRKATDLIPAAPADPEARKLAILNAL